MGLGAEGVAALARKRALLTQSEKVGLTHGQRGAQQRAHVGGVFGNEPAKM